MSESSLTPVQNEIVAEIYKAVEKLGGGFELLALIGSWGDTLTDGGVLAMLKDYNETGTYIKEVICQIDP